MTGKIGRKRVLKFRDFPARYHDDVFFVERGYDEELILVLFPTKCHLIIRWLHLKKLSKMTFSSGLSKQL